MKKTAKNFDIYTRLHSRHPLDCFFDDPKRIFDVEAGYRNEEVGFSDWDYEKRQEVGAHFQKYYFDTTPYKYRFHPTAKEYARAKKENGK